MTSSTKSLLWFDAHLDLAYMAQAGREMTGSNPAAAGGEDGPGCVTFPSLSRGNVKWAVATIFTQTHAPAKPYGYGEWSDVQGARSAAVAQLHQYQQWEQQGLVRIIKNAADLDPSPAADAPLQIIILMEGADPIVDNDDAAWWFEQGVRIVTLCWSLGSRYAGGNGMPSANGGLTEAGKSLVTRLDELGVIHDLTHLNDAAAGQLMHMTQQNHGKVIATHSASCTMQAGSPIKVDSVDPETVAQRHITDSMLSQLAGRNGMVGLPLYARFLTQGNEGRPSLERVVDHLDYLAQKLGEEGHSLIGIGSDFDGGFSANDTPLGLEGPEKLATLATLLSQRGWSHENIQAVACKNWIRYFSEALPE